MTIGPWSTRGHEVHRAAVHFDARRERALVCVQSRERRQKGRMDIEQAPREALDEARRQDAHESRERHEARRKALDRGSKRGVEGFSRGVASMLHHAGRDAARRGNAQPFGLRSVADHRAHRQPGFDKRLHVAAAAGDEDDDQIQDRPGPIMASARTQRAKSSPFT